MNVYERERELHKRTIQNAHYNTKLQSNVKQLRFYTAMYLINNPIIPLKINYVHIHRLQIVHYLDITPLYKQSQLHINNSQRIAEKLSNGRTPSVSSPTLHYLLSIT